MTDIADAQAWAAWAFAEADHWRKEAHYKHACWLMAMSDCGKAIEQEKARADVSESANDALRELLKEHRARADREHSMGAKIAAEAMGEIARLQAELRARK